MKHVCIWYPSIQTVKSLCTNLAPYICINLEHRFLRYDISIVYGFTVCVLDYRNVFMKASFMFLDLMTSFHPLQHARHYIVVVHVNRAC